MELKNRNVFIFRIPNLEINIFFINFQDRLMNKINVLIPYSCLNRHRQSVFCGNDGATEVISVVSTIRLICLVEIQDHRITGKYLQIKISAAAVGFLSVGSIVKRQKEMVLIFRFLNKMHTLVNLKHKVFTINSKSCRTKFNVWFGMPGRSRNLKRYRIFGPFKICCNSIIKINSEERMFLKIFEIDPTQ